MVSQPDERVEVRIADLCVSLSWTVTVTHMIALDEGQPSEDPTMAAQPSLSRQTSRSSLSSPYGHSRGPKRKTTTFGLTTSDGRAYLARWSPPAEDVLGGGSQDNLGQHSAAASAASLWSPTGNAPSQANFSTADQSRWAWTGVCFHPSFPAQEVLEEYEQLQEQALDRGKGASAVDVNSAMDLVAIGCEEFVPSLLTGFECGSADPPPSTAGRSPCILFRRRQLCSKRQAPKPQLTP